MFQSSFTVLVSQVAGHRSHEAAACDLRPATDCKADCPRFEPCLNWAVAREFRRLGNRPAGNRRRRDTRCAGAYLFHAFAIVRKTFGTGIGAGRGSAGAPQPVAAAVSSAQGEVLVTVARTDASLDEVMRTIEQALKER